MICAECKYVMDAFDRECPRCKHKQGEPITRDPAVRNTIPQRPSRIAEFPSDGKVVLRRNGQRFGPFSADEINEQLRSGVILPSDQAQIERDEWIVIRRLAGIIIPAPTPKSNSTEHVEANVISEFIYPSSITNDLPTSVGAGEWYYSSSGQRIGPVNGTNLKSLVNSHKITRDTLVWRSGMQDWCIAQLSELAPMLDSKFAGPPPLIGSAVNNNLIWILAFGPLLSLFIMGLVSGTWQVAPASLWWIAPLFNTALCFGDKAQLDKAGYNTDGLAFWAIVVVPVYLFMRAERLRQSNAYAWVWLATFFMTLMPFLVVVPW